MAAQVETQGQLQDFLDVLRKRRWQVLLPMIFLVALGSAIAVVVPRRYKVKTVVEVKETRVAEDPLLKTPGTASVNVELVNVQQHIRHYGKVKEIIEQLKWPDYSRLSEAQRSDYIHNIIDSIAVDVAAKEKSKGSTFVRIEYTDIDGVRAQTFLNRLAFAWQTDVINRDKERVEREQSRAQLAKDDARKRRDELMDQIADSAASIGLDWKDFFGTSRSTVSSADPVYESIQTNKALLAETRTELEGLRAAIEQRREHHANEPHKVQQQDNIAGAEYSKEINALRAQISRLKRDQQGLTKINSRYVRIEDEIKRFEEIIVQLEADQQEVITRSQSVDNPRKALLLAEVEKLEADESRLRARELYLEQSIAEAQGDYDTRVSQISKVQDLKSRLDLASEEYADAERVYRDKTAILGALKGPDGNPFEVVEEAQRPTAPEPPSPLVIVAFAGVAGLALGLASALIGEFSKNSYRNVTDFSRVLDLPVLGVVNLIVTAVDRRRARIRRITIAFSSAVLIMGLAWFTWAWKMRPDVLPTEVFNFLDSWSSGLR